MLLLLSYSIVKQYTFFKINLLTLMNVQKMITLVMNNVYIVNGCHHFISTPKKDNLIFKLIFKYADEKR